MTCPFSWLVFRAARKPYAQEHEAKMVIQSAGFARPVVVNFPGSTANSYLNRE